MNRKIEHGENMQLSSQESNRLINVPQQGQEWQRNIAMNHIAEHGENIPQLRQGWEHDITAEPIITEHEVNMQQLTSQQNNHMVQVIPPQQLLIAQQEQACECHKFEDYCEPSLNDPIKYNVSHIYHALFAYLDRDNVGLPGFAIYFKNASNVVRSLAEMLMKYQNLRGRRVTLHSRLMPVIEFENLEKGDALCAMELALSLENVIYQKLLNLHKVAQDFNEVQMINYIQSTLLPQQVLALSCKVYGTLIRSFLTQELLPMELLLPTELL